jgi:hypothetical protein
MTQVGAGTQKYEYILVIYKTRKPLQDGRDRSSVDLIRTTMVITSKPKLLQSVKSPMKEQNSS